MSKKQRAIDYFTYDSLLCKFRTPVSYVARKKMLNKLFEIHPPLETDKVLDLGASPDESLMESNLFDKVYPFKNMVTVASIEDCSNIVDKYSLKEFIKLDGSNKLPFSDKEFDLLHCNAVLEHVGKDNQEFFINECLRISKKVFLTTPNRFFPIEMHSFIPLLHWLPWKVFQFFVKKMSKNGEFWSKEENLFLLGRNDIKNFKLNSPIKISYIRTFWLKSNLLIHNFEE